jgi:predicted choloylglycine hydrolase
MHQVFKFPFLFFLSLALFSSNEKKKKKLRRKETDDDTKYMPEKVLRDEGKIQWVTNLILSFNQSMCMGMPDAQKERVYGHSCHMIVRDLLDKIKDIDECTFTLCACTIEESRKVICLVTQNANFFFSQLNIFI